MAIDKEKKLKHIQVKDNGIKLSNKIGDSLADLKTKFEFNIQENIVDGVDNLRTWQIKQNNKIIEFKKESAKLAKATHKEIKKDLTDDKTVNLTSAQALKISSRIDKGILFLQNSATKAYQDTVRQTLLTLRINKAVELKEALSRHLEKGLNVGVVYQDGKNFKFDTYWEMKTRTEIQRDIGKNMVTAGSNLGVVFYIAAYFGDCAKDHANYQGKIYVDQDWESNAPKDRIDEIKDYIRTNKIMTVQEIMGDPVYLTTRPNCRHYFQYIDIDSVLGAKTEKEVADLRSDMGLNFKGKYQPDKYIALQKQRANERQIRATKEEITKQETLLDLNPGDKTIQSRILSGEARVRKYQAEQRALAKQYSNIVREYKREAVGTRADLGVSKHLTKKQNDASIEMYKMFDDEIPEYKIEKLRLEDLEVSYNIETLKEIAKKYGIESKYLDICILQRHDKEFTLHKGYFGNSYKGNITIMPLAFYNEKTLVKTLIHEFKHQEQIEKYGVPLSIDDLKRNEEEAIQAEEEWYKNNEWRFKK